MFIHKTYFALDGISSMGYYVMRCAARKSEGSNWH